MSNETQQASVNDDPAINILECKRDKMNQRIKEIMIELEECRFAVKSIDETIHKLQDAPKCAINTVIYKKKKLTDLILDVLSSNGQEYTSHEIAMLISKLGRKTTAGSASSTLSRFKRNKIVKVYDGRWYLAKNKEGISNDT